MSARPSIPDTATSRSDSQMDLEARRKSALQNIPGNGALFASDMISIARALEAKVKTVNNLGRGVLGQYNFKAHQIAIIRSLFEPHILETATYKKTRMKFGQALKDAALLMQANMALTKAKSSMMCRKRKTGMGRHIQSCTSKTKIQAKRKLERFCRTKLDI